MLLGFLIIVVIIGALIGGKSLGDTIRKGLGALVLLLLVTVCASVYYLTDYTDKTSAQEALTSKVEPQVYVVLTESAAYKKPNIHSVISGSFSMGTELVIQDPRKFKYFYEVRQDNGALRYVLKVNLIRKGGD